MMAPKDVYILIPGTCEYVTLPGKYDLGCVIKLMIWRWRYYPGLFRWVQCNNKGPHKREAGG